MNKLILIFLWIISNSYLLIAQPTIQWQKCLGGSGSDYASSIQQTSDSGYIIVGFTFSNDSDVTGNHGIYDCWVVKLTSAGIIQWQKCLGGSDNDDASSIQQTSDGGYIIAGGTFSNDSDVTGNHGSQDYWVIKLNSAGTIQWQRCLGGSGDDRASSIQQTIDSGYIFVGLTFSNDSDVTGNHSVTGYSDYWVVKLTSIGSIQWQKCLGGSRNEMANSIQQTIDSGYIVAGTTNSNDGDVTGNHSINVYRDYWVVKLTSAGAIQWQKCLGGSHDDNANSIQQTTDGGYIVAGRTDSNDSLVTGNHGGYCDCWVVKLDSTGYIQWQKCLGGSDSESALSIQKTNDGGYIVGGGTSSNDGDVTGNHGGYSDFWVVKLDSTGYIQWQKCLGGSGDESVTSIQQTTDGGYIGVGTTNSNDVDVTGNNSINGNRDYWVVKLSSFVRIDEINNPIYQFKVFPNPINQSTTISFSLSERENTTLIIYDITGREVKFLSRSSLEPGEYSIPWDLTDNNNERVVDGFYLLTLLTEKEKLTKRIVVIN